jgi:hypothetical protein
MCVKAKPSRQELLQVCIAEAGAVSAISRACLAIVYYQDLSVYSLVDCEIKSDKESRRVAKTSIRLRGCAVVDETVGEAVMSNVVPMHRELEP